jgi:hypothetical protein
LDDFKVEMCELILAILKQKDALKTLGSTIEGLETTSTKPSAPLSQGPSPSSSLSSSSLPTTMPPIAPTQATTPVLLIAPVQLITLLTMVPIPITLSFAAPEPVAPTLSLTLAPWTLASVLDRSPLNPGVWEQYKTICKSVSGMPAVAGVSFLKSSNISLLKEEKVLVQQQHNTFKTFKVILQLCIVANEQFPNALEAFNDIAATTLTGMCTQLHVRNHMWMKKVLPVEVVPAWYMLNSTTITPTNQSHFFSALQYMAFKQQASKPSGQSNSNKSGGKQWNNNNKSNHPNQSSSSSTKGKPHGGKTWNTQSSTNNNTNSHGAGFSASHD